MRSVVEGKILLKYLEKEANSVNTTPDERRGLEKLKKRIDRQEIVVYQTDKSGKPCVASMES